MQRGYIYWHEEAETWRLKYRTNELIDGSLKRVHKNVRLCRADGSDHHRLCAEKGEHRLRRTKEGAVIVPKNLEAVRDAVLKAVNVNKPNTNRAQDMLIADFWEQCFVPYCETPIALTGKPRKKPSTMYGYRQIWRQHLAGHFGKMTLQEYEPGMGTQFLESLTGTQSKATLKHIKALGSSLFKRAVVEHRIKMNPWHDVEMPEDAIESAATEHYSLEEAEDTIRALCGHTDAQLVMALSCFLGLRPGEIAALRWEDFDAESVHIRRSVVRGHVDTPKTLESMAPLPIIGQVRVPLELWWQESGRRTEGYVFESRNGTPGDLHNLIGRVIRPHVEGKAKCVRCKRVPADAPGLRWKTLYAGRRGAITAMIEANEGDAHVGQGWARHKSMSTTLAFYKKAVSSKRLMEGAKKLEAVVGMKKLAATNDNATE
jgi:integrase